MESKGTIAATSFKLGVLASGIIVAVPPFIEKGEKIKVDTVTGEYIDRALCKTRGE